MSYLQLKSIMNNEKGGEFLLSIAIGDVFISFHDPRGTCLGFFLSKFELNTKNLQEVHDQFLIYFKTTNVLVEMKIIGTAVAIGQVVSFFTAKNFINFKKIIKEESCDVMFLPEVNKLRVSKNSNVAIINKKIKVLIVDDSKTIRTILSKIFSSDPQFEVCGIAERPSEVEPLILSCRPDVITLDIHMPEMDGVTLLKILTPKFKIPCVMISSISIDEGPLVLEALENGAVDYIQKPEMADLKTVIPVILEKVKTAALSRKFSDSIPVNKQIAQTKSECNLNSLVVIGASTGGTEAIRIVLMGLPNKIPPMLIVQHIPAVFSLAFANRMNDLCPFEVKEAEDGDEVKINRVLIAPGGKQMKMVVKNNITIVEVNNDEPVNRFKPSVDYLFNSVEKNINCHTVAVLLTGMGKDGATGMLGLKNKYVQTIAQDEKSCVVFGMPREAIELGAANYIEPLESIAEKICILTKLKVTKPKARIA
jgi:two-component system chemotaxis response regulator CheB